MTMNTMPFPDGSQEVPRGLLVALPEFLPGADERPYRAQAVQPRNRTQPDIFPVADTGGYGFGRKKAAAHS
jgi:hypothetical protein